MCSKIFQGGLLCLIACNLSAAQLPATSSSASKEDDIALDRVRRETLNFEGCSCPVPPRNECVSLQEAIFDVQSDFNGNHPYTFFTLSDLYYSGILDSRGDFILSPPPICTDFTTTFEIELAGQRCNDLMQRFILPHPVNSSCSWRYRCTQNQLQFPSFHVDAVLDNKANNHICQEFEVRIADWRFVKTLCKHNSSLPYWLYCNCGPKVIAYI